MYRVDIVNRQSVMAITDARVSEVVETVLQSEDVAAAELVVALVDDAEIHQVNREHLAHDYPTDVISFLYSSHAVREPKLTVRHLRGAGLSLEGELVISAETAVREAAEFGWQPSDELALYVVHGLLHLCGYDDQTEEEKVIMRQREKDILQKLDLTPNYG